jgi:hypothetical protein
MLAAHVMAELVCEAQIPNRATANRDSESVVLIATNAAHQVSDPAYTGRLADLGNEIGVVGISKTLDRRVISQIGEICTRVPTLRIDELLSVDHPNALPDLTVDVRGVCRVDRGLRVGLGLGITAEKVLCRCRVDNHDIDPVAGVDTYPEIIDGGRRRDRAFQVTGAFGEFRLIELN